MPPVSKILLGLACLGLLNACGPVVPLPAKVAMVDVDVTWLQAGAGAPVGAFSFAWQAPEGDEPLVDQRLQDLATLELTAKGARLEQAAPDWIFKLGHAVTMGEKMLPEKHHKEPYWQDGQLKEVTRYKHGVPVEEIVSKPGQWKEKTVAEPGGIKSVYVIKIALQAYPLPQGPNDVPRWEGSILLSQDAADPLKYAPAMIRELLREFPVGSGAPSHRRVPAR